MKPTSLRLRSGTLDTLRGLMSFFGGAAVSLATLLVLPETPVQFGVLTFLGSAALLTIPLRPLLSRIPPRPGLALSFALFLVLRDVNKGFLGLAGVPLLYLPRNWYANTLSAGLGFPASSPRTTFPCCRGCFSSGQGFISAACGLKPPPCRISACRESASSGGAPSWSICCTSR